MDSAEVGMTAAELASLGIVGQGFDNIDVEDGRRLRLLAFVDASFFNPFTIRGGKRYPLLRTEPGAQRFPGLPWPHVRPPL
jgi:hypothetical protein